jgi:hypothetical protein
MSERNPTNDPLVDQSEAAGEESAGREMQAANLFDLRRIIGGLFVFYGLLLTVLGLGDSKAEIAKAAGININLWAGLFMLAIGGLFLLWSFLRPLGRQLQESAAGADGGGGSRGDTQGAGGNPGARAE